MTRNDPGLPSRHSGDFLLLTLVNLMWAFQYSGARIATRELGPIAVTFLPMAFATVVLGVWLILSRRFKGKASVQRGSTRHQWLGILVLGIAGTSVAQLGLTSGVKRSLASNASIITLVIPILTALLATIIAGEKMNRLIWISFPLAIAGVLMVSDVDWHGVHLVSGKYLLGNALILAGCFGSAFYNVWSKRLLRVFRPLEVLIYSYLIVDVVLFIALEAREPGLIKQLRSTGWLVWLSLAAIAAFPLTSAMLLFLCVIQRINLTQASLSMYLLPVFGVLISSLVLKEKVTGHLFLGGVLVFLASFLATTYPEQKRLPRPAFAPQGPSPVSDRSTEKLERQHVGR